MAAAASIWRANISGSFKKAAIEIPARRRNIPAIRDQTVGSWLVALPWKSVS